MRALPERETSGRMSGGAARGTRRGWGRWLAAAVLFLALALLALQAGAHARAAGHMVHGAPAIAAAPDQGCDHSRGAARCLQDDRDALGGAAAAQDDCCAQFCTITALLPEGAQADPPARGEPRPAILADRRGRTPERLLRPPRSSIAA